MRACAVSKEIEEITYKVIGAAMAVHRGLGPGYEEKVYQKALEAQLTQDGVEHEPQTKILVHENGVVLGFYRIDFIVAQKVIVEIKSLQAFSNDHLGQVVTYLAATNLSVGLLINFSLRSLNFKRILPPGKLTQHRVNRRWLHVPKEHSSAPSTESVASNPLNPLPKSAVPNPLNPLPKSAVP